MLIGFASGAPTIDVWPFHSSEGFITLLAVFRLLLVLLIPFSLSANELLEYLKAYEGQWSGHFSIHSTASKFTQSFTVEQRYWWDGDILRGVAAFERDGGMETATSKTWFDGEKLICEVKRGEVVESYFGVLHEGGLLWISSDLKRANDYQMREVLTEKEVQPRTMMIEGFDTYITGDGLVHLIYKGELTLQAEEEAEDGA